jgi:putative MATE family efflux protein
MKQPTHATHRVVLGVAVPAIGESYLQSLVGVVDMFFIAKLGLAAIDAVGITNVFSMTYIGVFSALSAAGSIYMSRGRGAQDADQVWRGFTHALWLSTVIGLLIAILSVLLRTPLLQVMGAQTSIVKLALPYFTIVLGASPLIAWFTSLGAAFRALGQTRTPFRVGVEMNAVHIVLDALFIFGIGGWHGWGITGAAMATVLARTYGTLRLLQMLRGLQLMNASSERWAIQGKRLWNLFKLAVPAAAERLFMRLGQIIYFGFIVRMGVEAYGAHNIAGSLTTFASTIGSGFSVAATALIGQAIGEGRPEQAMRYRKATYRLAAVSMTGVSLLLCVTSPWTSHLFTSNATVSVLLTTVLAIDTLSQPFLAAVLVDTSVIQVGGNTLYPMVVTAAGMWGIRTLGVYVFGVQAGFGLPAVWVSIAADNAFRTLLFWLYRRRENWVKSISA